MNWYSQSNIEKQRKNKLKLQLKYTNQNYRPEDKMCIFMSIATTTKKMQTWYVSLILIVTLKYIYFSGISLRGNLKGIMHVPAGERSRKSLNYCILIQEIWYNFNLSGFQFTENYDTKRIFSWHFFSFDHWILF